MHQLHDAAELPQRARATIGVGKETSGRGVNACYTCTGVGKWLATGYYVLSVDQLQELSKMHAKSKESSFGGKSECTAT